MNLADERQNAFRAALTAEPDWQALLRHFDFNEGFALIFIFVESAENAVLCREALSDYLKETDRGNIRLIAPRNPDEAQNLPYLLHRPTGLNKRQTLWIESVVPEGSVSAEPLEEWRVAWRLCFAALNQVRNTLQRTIPGALTFVLAPWMHVLVRNIAPDLWSIRSTVVRLAPRLEGQQLPESSIREFRKPQTDPALAPDPEFAEREAGRLEDRLARETDPIKKIELELALARLLKRAAEGYLARVEPIQAIRVLEQAEVLELQSEAAPADRSLTGTLLGRAYMMDAQWNKAEKRFRDVLQTDEERLGESHVTVATDLSDLAELLRATNRLEEAEPLMRRALAIGEASYGADHPNVAIRLNNLAQLLQYTNRLEEAEPLMRRALAIDEASYGADHPNVAVSLNNLAQLLKATNRLGEAEPLMRRALAIDEASYGPDYPTVAIRLNNLAQLLQATNRLSEAEPLMRRALAIDEASYGPEHPNVAVRLNNLALLLQATNRLAEAEPLMRRALAIDEESYGPEHPHVAIHLNNLAQLLQATNRLEEAEPLMRRALAIDEASYGPGHPNVARNLNNLALLLQATNRLEEAEPLMRRVLTICEAFRDNTGYIHPYASTSRSNYQIIAEELGLSKEEIEDRLRSPGSLASS